MLWHSVNMDVADTTPTHPHVSFDHHTAPHWCTIVTQSIIHKCTESRDDDELLSRAFMWSPTGDAASSQVTVDSSFT